MARDELDLSDYRPSRLPRVLLAVSTLAVALVAAWLFAPMLLAKFPKVAAIAAVGPKNTRVEPARAPATRSVTPASAPVAPDPRHRCGAAPHNDSVCYRQQRQRDQRLPLRAEWKATRLRPGPRTHRPLGRRTRPLPRPLPRPRRSPWLRHRPHRQRMSRCSSRRPRECRPPTPMRIRPPPSTPRPMPSCPLTCRCRAAVRAARSRHASRSRCRGRDPISTATSRRPR